ncbi:hypothetical protein BV898_08043 [Hypsibius exemplaris]|uniref:G-protein coupled receptors family 1 profile domain-containing protein n=1 Tax=Hypsibius exemplaris TaxID=2072580 RepID=A0A1W0WRU4_HYPEX|nr:hypothetical protein BV898_08043 [Hypsibius exemplaris]
MNQTLTSNVTLYFGNLTYWQWVTAIHNQQWKEYPLTFVFFCIIMSMLCIVGASGNLYVGLSFCLVPVLKKIQYAFIANLTFIDLVVTLLVMPLNVVNTVYGPAFWEGKEWACETVGSICSTICAASVWSIMAIAIERDTGRRSTQAGNTLILSQTQDPIVGVDFRTEVKLVKVLFRVFLIFLISWLPVGVLFTISSGYIAPKWLNMAALILAHGNSASNSVVYFWLNNHLRESKAKFLRSQKTRASPLVQPTLNMSERRSGRANLSGAKRNSDDIAPS